MALNFETKPFPVRPPSLRLAAVQTYRWKSSPGRHSALFPGASKYIEHNGGKINGHVLLETRGRHFIHSYILRLSKGQLCRKISCMLDLA